MPDSSNFRVWNPGPGSAHLDLLTLVIFIYTTFRFSELLASTFCKKMSSENALETTLLNLAFWEGSGGRFGRFFANRAKPRFRGLTKSMKWEDPLYPAVTASFLLGLNSIPSIRSPYPPSGPPRTPSGRTLLSWVKSGPPGKPDFCPQEDAPNRGSGSLLGASRDPGLGQSHALRPWVRIGGSGSFGVLTHLPSKRRRHLLSISLWSDKTTSRTQLSCERLRTRR